MRIRKRFCMLLAVLLCLLLSVSAWAMLPQPGIYEKTDGSGRVTARMFIISLHGKGYTMPGSLTMKTFFGSPIIALQALDAEGNVTEELATSYIGKTRTAGAGETGLRLTTDQLRFPGNFQHGVWPAGGVQLCGRRKSRRLSLR